MTIILFINMSQFYPNYHYFTFTSKIYISPSAQPQSSAQYSHGSDTVVSKFCFRPIKLGPIEHILVPTCSVECKIERFC